MERRAGGELRFSARFFMRWSACSECCQAIHRNTLSGSLSGSIDFAVDQFQFNPAKGSTCVDVQFDYMRAVGGM